MMGSATLVTTTRASDRMDAGATSSLAERIASSLFWTSGMSRGCPRWSRLGDWSTASSSACSSMRELGQTGVTSSEGRPSKG